MQRFSLNKTLFICMFCWGVIVLCIAFTQNFTQLVALRSLQGLFECTISPAFLLITASFYVTREHTMRSIIWGTSNSGMDILTQLVMYGIGKAAKSHPGGWGPWRYISVFLGAWTIVMSVFSLLVLGTPNEVRWLSKEEKRIAAARVVSNQTGSDRQQVHAWRWDQVWTTFRDPQTYFFFVTVIVNSLPNGGTTAFGNLVYVSFGFTNLETLVKGTIPLNIVTIAWFLFVGILTLKKPNSRCEKNTNFRLFKSCQMLTQPHSHPHGSFNHSGLCRYAGIGTSAERGNAVDSMGSLPYDCNRPFARTYDLDIAAF